MSETAKALTEQELCARMFHVTSPGPVVHVGPAYPIQTFADFNDPYPGYFHGARVVTDSWLGEMVYVEEPAQNLSA